jgi:CRISPR/Cas system CSM-associated protein Csm3 (group 7 of RAMP superfamily)
MTGLYIARITIEAISPMSVGSGEAGVSDVSLVRDANGLPMISGASLQGLMKALAGREKAAGLALMGDDDVPAKIQFSDARIHGLDNVAVSGLLRDDKGVLLTEITDSLLKRYLVDEPLLRDHVKIDHRGTGEDHGKFDRAALPRGTRFSFELTMWGNAEDEDAFTAILALVHHPLFRPGGATRRGYGRVKVFAGGWAYWPDPVASLDDIDTIRRATLSKVDGLPREIPKQLGTDLKPYELKLTSKSWWRAGGDGERVWKGEYEAKHKKNAAADNRKDEADLAFTREPFVCWPRAGSNHMGWVNPEDTILDGYVLSGSSIRGALWHRTLFHWNLKHRPLLDANAPDLSAFAKALKVPAEIHALFGSKKDGESGQRSALIVEDMVFTPDAVTVADLVSIDRFTGGARTGALFNEELISTGEQELTIEMTVDTMLLAQRLSVDDAFAKVLAAFDAAVNDLCEGRLALGAKSSGYFTRAKATEAAL